MRIQQLTGSTQSLITIINILTETQEWFGKSSKEECNSPADGSSLRTLLNSGFSDLITSGSRVTLQGDFSFFNESVMILSPRSRRRNSSLVGNTGAVV